MSLFALYYTIMCIASKNMTPPTTNPGKQNVPKL